MCPVQNVTYVSGRAFALRASQDKSGNSLSARSRMPSEALAKEGFVNSASTVTFFLCMKMQLQGW
jgi:hypothetical protein